MSEVEALHELHEVSQELARLRWRRDELVAQLVELGVHRRRIAVAAGITRQHTYNITKGIDTP